MDPRIQHALHRIEIATGEYEHDAVNTLVVCSGPEVVSRLTMHIENAAEQNSRYFKETAYTGHLYGLHILTILREPEAHIPLLQLCTAPPRLAEVIFGEEFMETELERALAATADGDTAGLVRLIEDPGIHDDIRRAAINGLVRMAAFGDADRREVVDCLGSLFDSIHRKPSPIWEDLTLAARFLAAEMIWRQVRQAWKDGLIFGDWKEVSCDLKADWEVQRPDLQQYFEVDESNERSNWWNVERRLSTSGFCQSIESELDGDAFEEELENEIDEQADEDEVWN